MLLLLVTRSALNVERPGAGDADEAGVVVEIAIVVAVAISGHQEKPCSLTSASEELITANPCRCQDSQ